MHPTSISTGELIKPRLEKHTKFQDISIGSYGVIGALYITGFLSLIPAYRIPAADLCDTCSFCTIDPVFSFDRLDSGVKTRHNCNSQTLSTIPSRTDISDSSAKSHESIISILRQLIIGCVGSQPIFLTAKELVAPCNNIQYHAVYILSQYARKMPISYLLTFFSNRRTYIDLDRVSNDHWAHRAINRQDRKTILNMEELLEFLNLTKSSFGAFKVELDDGMQHYFRLYIKSSIMI